MSEDNGTMSASTAFPPSADGFAKVSQLDPARHGWLTASEAAEEIGVTPQAVRRAAREGRIIARRPAWLGKWLVPASEVERILAEGMGVRHA